MAAAEIERFVDGRRSVNLANPRSSALQVGNVSASHILAIDLGTGSCRAIVFDRRGGPAGLGQREWSHASHARGSRAPRSSTPTAAGSSCATASRCPRPRRAWPGRDIAAVSSSEHARGHGALRRGGPRDLGVPERGLAGRQPGRPTWSARPGTRDASSSRAATGCPSRRRPASCGSRNTSPRPSAAIAHVGMLSDWVLTRLTGRFVTDPSCGSSSDLFDLSTRSWSSGVPRARRRATRGHARGARAGHRHGRGHRGRGAAPRVSRRARPSWSGAATPSWASSASARRDPAG